MKLCLGLQWELNESQGCRVNIGTRYVLDSSWFTQSGARDDLQKVLSTYCSDVLLLYAPPRVLALRGWSFFPMQGRLWRIPRYKYR